MPSLNPSNTPQPTETKCYDIPGWFSADSNTSRNHYDCEWFCSPVYDDDDGYYEEGDTRCGLYGDESENFGYTANEACCCKLEGIGFFSCKNDGKRCESQNI